MADYSNTKNGSGIDSEAYIYVQLQVTRTDYATYSHFDLKSVAVSNTGSSGFIKGQVTTNQSGTSWTAVTGWKDVYYNGTTVLATSSFDIDRGASDKTVSCGAYAQGGGTGRYAGGEDYAWLNVTVPRVLAPNGPSSVLIHQPWEDTSVRLYWTNGATSAERPRDATLIERKTDEGGWVQIASVSSSTSNYTDNGITVNHKYVYRLRAKNVAGYSSYAFAFTDIAHQQYIVTTPAAPSNVTAALSGASTVVIDATSNSPYAQGYEVQRTSDGGQTWQEVARSETLPISDSAPAGTVQYRMLAFIDDRESPWSYSNELVTICPPLAPTITATPPNPSVVNTASTIAWTPNHPDGSSQQAAQVKLTNPSGTELTYAVQSNSYQFTPTQSGTWTAQVRTKGIDPSWGEWSQAVSWGVYQLPVVEIRVPDVDGANVVSLPLGIEWAVTDSTGVSTQRVVITGDGGEVLNRTVAGNVRTLSLSASEISLVNGENYTILLRVMGGSGLVAEQTRVFHVAWVAPAAPIISVNEAEGKSAAIDISFGHGSVATESVTLQRVNADGSTWTIASSLADGTSCIDPLPPLCVPVTYRATASAASGATASVEHVEQFGNQDEWALNFGNAAGEEVTLRYDLKNTRSLDHGGTSYHFADGGAGGGLPVFYPTTDRDQKGSLKFALIYHDDADRLFELSDANPVGWIRDSNGRRWRAKIAFRESYIRGPIFQMTADWQAVRWREAW